MTTPISAPERRVPTLRSIADLHQDIDPELLFDLSKMYGLDINPTSDEQIARQGVWHPSSCGYCKRKEVYQFIRTPPSDTHSKSLEEIFELGHMGHAIVQRRLERLVGAAKEHGLDYEFRREVGFDVESDVLYLELGVGGTCDGIALISGPDFEQRALVEIKTISGGDPWKRLIKRDRPIHHHLLQAHLYAYRFDLPIIFLFYVNKSTGKRKVFTLLYDAKIAEEAFAYFTDCNAYVARGELPSREESYYECKECPYRSLCKPDVLKRVKAAALPKTRLRRR